MTSFFDKFNEKLNGKLKQSAAKAGAKDAAADFSKDKNKQQLVTEELESEKLLVDVYHNSLEVVIYALAAGVDPNDFDVTLDEENDMLTIKGARKRPLRRKKDEGMAKDPDGKFIEEGCSWTPFFRKIILPVEVDAVKAEAVFKKGVLIVSLPVLNITEGRKLTVVETLSSDFEKAKQ
jgi:HSP20 family molecular chaperone IbpA